MIRGDNIVCGTSSNGTGTLTLASTPANVGALDFYAFATAINGYTNGKVLLVPYTLIEFADSTFSVPVREETGIGTLTLGANLAATTLARTTVLTTGVVGGAYVNASATAVAIGTAGNTLILMGQASSLLFSGTPYWDAALSDQGGLYSVTHSSGNAGNTTLTQEATGQTIFFPWVSMKPVFAKVARIRVSTIYTGGTTTGFLSLYQDGTNGRPGRLLVDFGTLGASPFNSGSVPFYLAATAATGIYLPPGEYWGALYFTYTGGSGSAVVSGLNPAIVLGRAPISVAALAQINNFSASGGASTAPDPAASTGYAATAMTQKAAPIWMSLGPS